MLHPTLTPFFLTIKMLTALLTKTCVVLFSSPFPIRQLYKLQGYSDQIFQISSVLNIRKIFAVQLLRSSSPGNKYKVCKGIQNTRNKINSPITVIKKINWSKKQYLHGSILYNFLTQNSEN